ncbi:MAG TPA: hypothetical protein VG937_14425 [Polyangiaceae bacterium]|nr:hypothetical protein [Polyangiaceae bacterium]
MKQLHRPDLYGFSVFDEARNIDFHSVLWLRANGNALFDPLPLSDHDLKHLLALGGAAHVFITNSDHVRDSARIAERCGARLYGPAAEKVSFAIACDEWLGDDAEPLPGLQTLALSGSKTPGELAFLLERTTLITGDLVRAFRAGALDILPDAKLSNRAEAIASVRRIVALPDVDAVLPGDGWPVFRNAQQALRELDARLG